MSDVFMDTHRRSRHSHKQRNTLQTSASVTTMTTTSESPTSPRHANDHTFCHQNKSSTADSDRAAHNANLSFNNRKGEDENFDGGADKDDAFANIISLKLRRPKHWKWELSTSKSCSNIALPRILLYDHKGQLLADAQGDTEQIYKQEEEPKREKPQKRSHQSKQRNAEYVSRSATTNLTHSIRDALETEFNGLNIQEATPSPEPYSPLSISSHRSHRAIDFDTTDLPDYSVSRRSSSLKGVRFNVGDKEHHPVYESQIPEFLPTPPSTTTPTSSSSGPREKRKYRRSQSSGRSSAHSESILERFSYQKGRFSSPEYAEDKELKQGSRYFLRTCKAGTLVIKEDSFCQHPKRRRRPRKNRSIDSLRRVQKTRLSSSSPTPRQYLCDSPTPSDISHKRKQQHIHRYLNDASIALSNHLSTSEDEFATTTNQKPLTNHGNSRHLRKYSQERNQAKDLNYSTDVHQNGKVR